MWARGEEEEEREEEGREENRGKKKIFIRNERKNRGILSTTSQISLLLETSPQRGYGSSHYGEGGVQVDEGRRKRTQASLQKYHTKVTR